MTRYCCDKDDKNLAILAGFLKVISEENRLKIICFLQPGERCVCEIWRFLELPQNLISHHLKVLKDANILESRKEGLKVYYSINQAVLNEHRNNLSKILGKGEK
jgi:ArsR family transcriptional regulator